MTGDTGLRGLLAKAEATPDAQREWESFWVCDEEARLFALCPDAVALLVDMAEWIADGIDSFACQDPECPCSSGRRAALLARFRELGERAR